MAAADEQPRAAQSGFLPRPGRNPPEWAPRAIAGRRSRAEIESLLDDAITRSRIITLVTYYLSDYGETVMNAITSRLLTRFERPDLNDVVYTCLKELVMNAGKANLKRIVFAESGLDPMSPEDYDRGMVAFKQNLPERRIKSYRSKFRKYNLPVTVTFYYEPFRVLKIKIKNVCTLWPTEEERIREKFRYACDYQDLMQFYLAHGDETEGAGMGMALVGILLDQLGIDRHLFSIYSSERYNETIARLEIPLCPEYESRRARFEREWRASGLDKDTFRAGFV
jgi:hypothetical protein